MELSTESDIKATIGAIDSTDTVAEDISAEQAVGIAAGASTIASIVAKAAAVASIIAMAAAAASMSSMVGRFKQEPLWAIVERMVATNSMLCIMVEQWATATVWNDRGRNEEDPMGSSHGEEPAELAAS